MELIVDFLQQLDQHILLSVHHLSSPFLDVMMAGITEKYNWVPLYLVLMFVLLWHFGWRGLYPVIAVILLVVLSDQLTSSLIKPWVGRFRPCHDPQIGHLIRIVTKCGGYYGFVSSHAANSFAVTTFFWLLLRKSHPGIWLLLIWPLTVSYSRIYLGVHYPSDVLGGAMVGGMLGFLVFKGTQLLSRKVPFPFTPFTKN